MVPIIHWNCNTTASFTETGITFISVSGNEAAVAPAGADTSSMAFNKRNTYVLCAAEGWTSLEAGDDAHILEQKCLVRGLLRGSDPIQDSLS